MQAAPQTSRSRPCLWGDACSAPPPAPPPCWCFRTSVRLSPVGLSQADRQAPDKQPRKHKTNPGRLATNLLLLRASPTLAAAHARRHAPRPFPTRAEPLRAPSRHPIGRRGSTCCKTMCTGFSRVAPPLQSGNRSRSSWAPNRARPPWMRPILILRRLVEWPRAACVAPALPQHNQRGAFSRPVPPTHGNLVLMGLRRASARECCSFDAQGL